MTKPMTVEQMANCDGLARQIAELDPNWPVSGMSCRLSVDDDGEIRDLNYRLADGNIWAACHLVLCDTFSEDSTCDEAVWLRQAKSSGPDWRDPYTLGALLFTLGESNIHLYMDGSMVLVGAVSFSVQWHDSHKWQVTDHYGTRPEAVLAAKVQQLKLRPVKS